MTFALALAMCLGFLLPVFSNIKASDTASAASSLTPLETIVGTDISGMTGTLRTDGASGLGQTPFDGSSKQVMPGYSITPLANSFNEITNRTYSVNEFTVGREISIFIWIYFPDDPVENYYDLNLKFYNNSGETIEWDFNYERLREIMYPMALSYEFYGWKQLELVYNDAQKNYTDISDKKFSSFEINYKISEAGAQLPNRTTNGKLSFYNVFTHGKMNESTSIIDATDYAYYGLNPEFLKAFYNLYVGSSYKLKSISDIFDYIYVGKSNLTLNGVQNNLFEWQISLKHYTEEIDGIRIGDTLPFDSAGEYVLNIKLFEQVNFAGSKKMRTVLSASHTISIMKYTFGIFSSSTYDVDKNTTVTLRFDVSDDFVPEESFGFSVENEKIASIESFEYDSELHAYYIKVKGLKKGTTKVKISAKGYRESDKVSTEFVESTSVVVKYSGLSPWILTLIYVILGFYGVAFIIFLSISFVNSRRNIVK